MKCYLCLDSPIVSITRTFFQAAVTERGFDAMRTNLGVQFECFASPLNCHFAWHCSAFPDTDNAFGSLGSFFDFHPTTGSFEANPPYIPEILTSMAEHMSTLLGASDAPLSFVVVVPVWTDCAYWKALVASAFNTRDHLIWTADAHGFCDGAQHTRPAHQVCVPAQVYMAEVCSAAGVANASVFMFAS